MREHLKSLHPQNAENFDVIEKSLFVISFDEREPQSESEVSFKPPE